MDQPVLAACGDSTFFHAAIPALINAVHNEAAFTLVPLTRGYVGTRFVTREGGRLRATPLLLVLLMIETSDVGFALDSIPAVFGISRDPFIVFTSNVCAVLGLRAMFFLLQHVLDRFAYLKYGLGLVLVFIGGKMIVNEGVFGLQYHVATGTSLAVVAGLICVSIVLSAVAPRKSRPPVDDVPESSLIADIDPSDSIDPMASLPGATLGGDAPPSLRAPPSDRD